MNKSVYLIRHAESESNAGCATSNFANIRLTAAGHVQAKSFAQDFAIVPSLIVTSSFLRARQTAGYFSDLHKEVAVVEWPVHEFVFVTFPESAATTRLQRKPTVDEYWKRNNPEEKNVGSESFSEFWLRVKHVYDLVQRHRAETVVVFTHEFFMQAFTFGMAKQFPDCSAEIMSKLYAQSRSTPMDNLSIREFRFPIQTDQVVDTGSCDDPTT